MKITKSKLKEIIKEEYSSILNEAVGNFMAANLAYINLGLMGKGGTGDTGAIRLLMDGEGISRSDRVKVREVLAAFETFKTLAVEALGPEVADVDPVQQRYEDEQDSGHGDMKGWR